VSKATGKGIVGAILAGSALILGKFAFLEKGAAKAIIQDENIVVRALGHEPKTQMLKPKVSGQIQSPTDRSMSALENVPDILQIFPNSGDDKKKDPRYSGH